MRVCFDWFRQCTPFQPRAYSKTFMTMMQFENLGCWENRILVYIRFRTLDFGGQISDFLTSFGFCIRYFNVTPIPVGGFYCTSPSLLLWYSWW